MYYTVIVLVQQLSLHYCRTFAFYELFSCTMQLVSNKYSPEACLPAVLMCV